jgi:transposase-like protein
MLTRVGADYFASSTVLNRARTARRRLDASAAERFFQKALRSPAHPRPRVINVDGNPAYPNAINELKRAGELNYC